MEDPANNAFEKLPSEKINLNNKQKSKKDEGLEKDLANLKEKYGLEFEPAKSCKYKIEKVISYISSKYIFRYNVIMNQLEFCEISKEKNDVQMFRNFDNRDFKSLLIELKRSNYVIGKEGLKDLLESRDMSKDHDPFKDYLFNLCNWDERTDHIKRFLQQVQLVNESDNREDFILSFKKWLVAMVASLLNDEVCNQWCFVLVGKGSIFKTTFLNNLVPQTLRKDYLYSSPFNFESKDHFKYLGMKLLINLDELARFNRTDQDVLKAILTENRPVLRLPYGEFDTKMVRKASFCGSTNHKNFLKDETGNRRFLVFEVENITLDKEFDLGLIFSQALDLYKSGFHYWFDSIDDEKTEVRNVNFHDTSIEEDLVNQFIEMPSAIDIKTGTGFKWMTPTAINIELVTKSNSRVNVNETTKKRIGLILSKLGFINKRVRLNNKTARVWAVRFVDTPTIESLGPGELFKDGTNEDII